MHLLLALLIVAQAQWPLTRPERTEYGETSRYTDIIVFIEGLQSAGAPICLQYIGTSKDGKRMPLVIASRPPVAGPNEAKRSGKPVFYIQANIHGGEIEGKEAIQHLLRKWCQNKAGPLSKGIFLIQPIYNIDGNEKWGPQERNRPEQNGPAIVGERASGEGFDLNRDCIKAESLEFRAALKSVYTAWEPDVIMDLHTTDGTRHGYKMTYAPPHTPNMDPALLRLCRDEMPRQLRRAFGQNTPLFEYGDATKEGWTSFGEEGRYVSNYAGLRNRIGVLTEAPTYLPFRERVLYTETLVQAVVDYVLANSRRVMKMIREADSRSLAGKELGVRFGPVSRGVEEVLLEAPDAPNKHGTPTKLIKKEMPVFDRYLPTRSARAPEAYFVPAESVELLRRHGVLVERLIQPWKGDVEEFTITEVVTEQNPFQGHQLNRLEGHFSTRAFEALAGSYLVRTGQPLGTLAFHMLEPEGLDGLAGWGLLSEPFKTGQVFAVRKAHRLGSVVTEQVP